MYNSKYWLALEYTWKGWPDREMDGLFKWYYLVQFAFWLQQILVVNIEERRKDYAQMFTHHIVTCALMASSYGYHHYKIGNVILVTMDSVDTIFPVRSARRRFLRIRLTRIAARQNAQIPQVPKSLRHSLWYIHAPLGCLEAHCVPAPCLLCLSGPPHLHPIGMLQRLEH